MFAHLNAIDTAVIIVYFVGVFGIGLWVSRGKDSEADYFLAGRTLPWYAICFSLFATNISTSNFIGFTGLGYTYGFSLAGFEWTTIFGLIALAFVFLPLYLRSRVVTLPEFVERRYDTRARLLLSGGVVLLYIFMELSSFMYLGAMTIETVTGIPFMVALIGIAVSVGVYTAWGGLAAVVWTDVIQAIFLYGGGAIVSFCALKHVGGLSQLMADLPEKFHVIQPASHPMTPWPAVLLCGLPLLAIWYWATSQVIVQRALGARTEWDARMGVVTVGFLKLAGPFIMVLPGIIAFKLYPGLEHPDAAYPMIVRDTVPVGLTGLVLAGLIAALMSSADSVLNTCSTLVTHDFYLRLVRKEVSQKGIVLIGRITTVMILLIAIAWAPVLRREASIIAYNINLMGFLAAPFVALFIAGVFSRRPTPTAAICSIIVSVPVNIWLWYAHGATSALYRIPIAFACSLLCLIVCSAFTRPRELAEIQSLLWRWGEVWRNDTGLLQPLRSGYNAEVTGTRLPFYRDYRLVALAAVLATAAMFIYFR